jgi:hypothetical protein
MHFRSVANSATFAITTARGLHVPRSGKGHSKRGPSREYGLEDALAGRRRVIGVAAAGKLHVSSHEEKRAGRRDLDVFVVLAVITGDTVV